MKKVYHKLIRDKIPEIIEGTVDKESLIKEIADVLEVIDALKVAYDSSDSDE